LWLANYFSVAALFELMYLGGFPRLQLESALLTFDSVMDQLDLSKIMGQR
jgi:hypothetical protein